MDLGKALYIQKRKEAPIQIFLSGHMDTVFPVDSLFQKVTKISANKWRGPGITDMKGGLLVILEALKILEQSPYKKYVGWKVFIDPDEEIGSPGSQDHILQLAQGSLAALVFEPAFADGSLVSSRKGSINLTLISKGKKAHAGRDFEKGENAILKLARLMTALEKSRGVNVNFGAISGGEAFNIVPDLAQLKVNIRGDKQIDLTKFLEDLDSYIADKQITKILHSHRGPKPFDKATKNLLTQIHPEIKVKSSGGVSDGNLLASLEIPVLDTLGVVGGLIHTHEEYIELDSLYDRSEKVGRWLVNLGRLHAEK